jgi:hypothetical protein
LISPLASYVRTVLVTYQTGSAPPAEPGAPELVAPELRAPAPPSTAAQLAPEPAKPPEPASPNPARRTGARVAIVSFAAAGVFTGLGIGWSVYAQNAQHNAQALSAQGQRAGGTTACASGGGVSPANCNSLLSAWQTQDAAGSLRDGWFGAASVTAAIGAAVTVWVLNQPATVNGQPQTQILLRPGGLVFSGTF